MPLASHAKVGTAFWSGSSALTTQAWSIPGRTRLCERLPPNLHLPVGAGAEEPVSEGDLSVSEGFGHQTIGNDPQD